MDQSLKHVLVGEMFEQNYAWLCARVRKHLRSWHGAEDIAAEAFSHVLAHPDPAGIREPRAWLTTIAQRLLYESWRRRDLERAYAKLVQDEPEGTQCSAEEQTLLVESLLIIDKLLDGLPGQGKAAFIYSQLGGLTYSQIAHQLSISTSRVQQYMTEAFKLCYRVVE